MNLQNVKTFIKKALSRGEIKKIRESQYFDQEYYLIGNFDVYSSRIDPATHFYNYGWKENRRPNRNFNIDSFFEKYPDARQLEINPISYILEKGLQEETEDFVTGGKMFASDLIESFFSESWPLKTLPIDSKEKRINIIFNGFDEGCFFGGKATALVLATTFAQKYNYSLRVIAQNPDAKIFYKFLKLFDIDFDKEVEFYSTESSKMLEVGTEDHFICTMWTNADAVLNTESIQGKVFYIMQEVETFFYDHGDYHLRCYNTLTNKRLIPIVNSKLLFDYFLGHGYENVNNGVYFEPAFSRKLLSPSKESFKRKAKYKLFFYARPSHQRNLFYFGLQVLNEAFLQGILNKDEWEVYLAGDTRSPTFKFDNDVKIYDLGIMKWEEYCAFASQIDLCYSMIYTPHPSYPPFDFVCSGAVVLTNKYANKEDLHKYSKNIVSAELKIENMLDKLNEAVDLTKNNKLRKKNFQSSNINENWEDSFNQVLPFIESKIKSKENV